ncbi:MAG TPA: winged helix-turn-helix domain-containing protein [Micromonosporaceae bacterium]|nr:winged helix-turn-helix domain-containing protein [Micromonosporaceae bacterium]
MAWRIHFTAEDLARTRVSASLGPLAETLFGLSLLRCSRRRPAAFSGWRDHARGRLTADLRPLVDVVPLEAGGVDLLTLTGEAPTIEHGIEALLAMPRERVLAELEFSSRDGGVASSAWSLADRDTAARKQLARAARAAYRTLVEPHWARVSTHLQAERAARGRMVLEGGVERLLATLHPPRMRWRLPVLEVLGGGEMDLHLDGRGLVLIPSVFVGTVPVLLQDLTDETAPPRLIFPVAMDPAVAVRLWGEPEPGGRALAALVGRTRAAVLSRIADGCTTSEIARHIGISPAAASQHATVLRDAGLITTRRQGGAVLHALTRLGVELLEGR